MYEILIRRNNQKLYRVIRGYIGDDAEIEDIMQNTYLKAFKKLYQFKHCSTFTTWLIRIGINEALARLREKKKLLNLSVSGAASNINTIIEMPGSDQLNPEKRIILKEARQQMEHAIDSLDVDYRTVYIMKEIEEMKIAEISECLNISISNAKVRLHRAKNMLREKLHMISSDNSDIFGFGFSRCDNIIDGVMEMVLGTH